MNLFGLIARYLYVPGAMRYDSAGTIQAAPLVTKRTVVMPASYTQGTGAAVDLSTVFSTLLGVRVLRAYVTATGAEDTRLYAVREASTDTFANRKFRVVAYKGNTPAATMSSDSAGTPAGTVGAPVFTGNAVASGAPSATVSVGSSAHTHTPTQRSGTCVATCTCASGSGLTGTASMNPTGAPSATTTVGDSAHTHTTTAAGTNSAPAFTGTALGTHTHTPTGTAETTIGAEVANAVDLSTITVEYEAVGIV